MAANCYPMASTPQDYPLENTLSQHLSSASSGSNEHLNDLVELTCSFSGFRLYWLEIFSENKRTPLLYSEEFLDQKVILKLLSNHVIGDLRDPIQLDVQELEMLFPIGKFPFQSLIAIPLIFPSGYQFGLLFLASDQSRELKIKSLHQLSLLAKQTSKLIFQDFLLKNQQADMDDPNSNPDLIKSRELYFNSIQKNIELFELINQTTKDAIYDWDIATDRLEFGESFNFNFGYPFLQNNTYSSAFWKSLIHPEDRKSVENKLGQFLANRLATRWENDYRLRRYDGTYALVEGIGTLIRDENGKPVRMVGVIRDVTAYKSMQSILEDSNTIAKLGGWELDVHANRLSWSKTVNTIFGVPMEFYPNPESSLQFYRADYRGLIRTAIREVILQKTPFNLEVILITASGKEKWVRLQGHGEFEGDQCLKVLGSIQDIHDYKSMQIQLERLSDNIPGVVFQYQLNPDGTDKILYMSKGSHRVWGLSPEECVANTKLVWDLVMQGGNGEQVKADITKSATDLTRWHSTWKVIKPDGTIAIMEGYGNPQKRADGSIIWDSIILDITEKDRLAYLLQRTKRLARVGSWELYISGVDQFKIVWSDSLKWILDYPDDQEVSLESTLGMLSEQDREKVMHVFRRFTEEEIHESIELELLINRFYLNDAIWVKLVVQGEYINGKCLKISGSAQDINSSKLGEIEIQYQNALLNSLTEVLGHLFVEENWSDVIEGAFNLIGNTVDVDRIYIFENIEDPHSGKKFATQTFEWVAPGISSQMNNPELERIEVDEFIEVFHGLEENHPLIANVSEIEDPDLRAMLQYQEIKSVIMFPIFIEKEFWGFIGFDECGQERDWKASEVNFLRYFSSNLESAIKRRKDKISLENLVFEKSRILESIDDGFFVMDTQAKINYWNKAAETLFGIPREKIVGQVLWDRFPAAAHIHYLTDYLELIEKCAHFHVEEYFPSFGKWLEINAYPAKNTLSLFFKDITERKNFEEAIIQSHERFEIISKATQDIIWDFDIEKPKLYVSEGFNAQFGYEPSEELNSMEKFINYLHPDDRESIKNEFTAALFGLSSDNNLSLEYRFLKNDQSYAHIQHKTYFIRDKNGKAIRALGAMMDISARKIYEQSLENLNQELEEKIRQLAVTNKELEQFAYVTSHDLQEPLRMISSFMTILENKYANQLDDKARQYIGFAVDGAKRMRQLILDLLQYSRSGKNDTEKEIVDLNEILHQTTLFNKKLIEEKEAEIRSQPLPTIKTYKVPITQVIQNLVENGIKYSKPEVPPLIQIQSKDLGKEWLISVADNGIGIPEEFHDKVFIIFQRLHSKEEYKGTGIGLAVVKKQVESWGGKIWLKSKQGEGTTFFFTIPKA